MQPLQAARAQLEEMDALRQDKLIAYVPGKNDDPTTQSQRNCRSCKREREKYFVQRTLALIIKHHHHYAVGTYD